MSDVPIRLEDLYRVEEEDQLSRYYIFTGSLTGYGYALNVASQINRADIAGVRSCNAVSYELNGMSTWAIWVSVTTTEAWSRVNKLVNVAVERLAQAPT